MTTLEQIAQRHLDADSWADEAMMLAALRAAAEQCAKIAEAAPDTYESAGGPGSGVFRATSRTAAAIRKWAEGKP